MSSTDISSRDGTGLVSKPDDNEQPSVAQAANQCVNSVTGEPKHKYTSRGIASSFMRKRQKTNPVLLETYKCRQCNFWHFGKTKTLYAFHVKQKQRKATDERLVGKLIGALRNTPTRSYK